MILLEVNNRVVEDVLRAKWRELEAGQRLDWLDVSVADFDGALMHLSNEPEERARVRVSLRLECLRQADEELGVGGAGKRADEGEGGGAPQDGREDTRREGAVMAELRRMYGRLLAAEPEAGFTVSLVLDVREYAGAERAAERELVIRLAAGLRRNCFAAIFHVFFELQARFAEDERLALQQRRLEIQVRDTDSLYLEAKSDRVTVIFATEFRDESDMILGRVFMQEFREGRKASHGAPQVLVGQREPPLELRRWRAQCGLASAAPSNQLCYVTFVLFPRHTSGEEARARTVDLMHQFRDYLHYHIKCSKAYVHSRLRAKTADLLKVLNRSRPERPRTAARKTITGRTFVQR